MNYLNEQFIGEEIDCEALGVGTIVEITESEVKIATEFGVIELALEDVELTEEVEELEELSTKTMANYASRAMNDVRNSNQAKIRWQNKTGTHTLTNPKTGMSVDKTSKEMEAEHDRVARNREKGVRTVLKKLAKEEVELEEGQMKPYVKPHYDAKENQSGWKAANKHGKVKFFGKDFKAAAMKHAGLNEGNLEELSLPTLKSYSDKRGSQVFGGRSGSPTRTADNQIKKDSNSINKMALAKTKISRIKNTGSSILRNEEVELEEGRGRKPKQPKEGEKPTAAWLRHLERQKAGDKPEKEEVEALGAQLRKAVSINKPVTFLNGDKKEVTAGHAELFHDHMTARKMTADKQKFQNDAHASHDAFMKAIKSPIPGR